MVSKNIFYFFIFPKTGPVILLGGFLASSILFFSIWVFVEEAFGIQRVVEISESLGFLDELEDENN